MSSQVDTTITPGRNVPGSSAPGARAAFASRFYQSSDGLQLHYREYAGPSDAPLTVLCLPGLTRNARDFEDLAPHLARRYRVFCAEFRGRGLSAYAPNPATYVPPVYVGDMAALLKAAGVSQVAVIGTSLGGLVATLMTAVMPAKILGVVLNDIGPVIDPAGLARIAGYLGKGRPLKSWEDAAAVVEDMDGVIYPDYGKADWLRMARRRFIATPDGGFRPDYDFKIAEPFAGGATPDLWPYFARLRLVPTLALRGATSDILAPETFARMGEVIPALRRVEVPNRGHTPYLDEPSALSAIDTFMAGLPPRLGMARRIRRSLSAAGFLVRLKLAGKI
ncbi:MAG: alpha/beta hydrolase [Rhodospirillaceae bacterium]|nr:MAG: alpha/beta hydrolase [Rhodospirillaceae bacterium]